MRHFLLFTVDDDPLIQLTFACVYFSEIAEFGACTVTKASVSVKYGESRQLERQLDQEHSQRFFEDDLKAILQSVKQVGHVF